MTDLRLYNHGACSTGENIPCLIDGSYKHPFATPLQESDRRFNFRTHISCRKVTLGQITSGLLDSEAVQIALVHLLFNLIGILMIYPLPATRAIPLAAANRLADIAVRSKTVALGYVLGLFYGVPALLVLMTRLF